MVECGHKHKVCESHLRTALKGVTAKALEVLFDFIVLDLLFHNPVGSLGAAIGLEALCYGLNYLNERGWNKIQWQRKVVDVSMVKTTQHLNKTKASSINGDGMCR